MYMYLSGPDPQKVPPSSSSSSSIGHLPVLEDSGDMFESRASSAVTMCPSPAVATGTPLVRTHPFSFRSPVPSTPEFRSHDSRSDYIPLSYIHIDYVLYVYSSFTCLEVFLRAPVRSAYYYLFYLSSCLESDYYTIIYN